MYEPIFPYSPAPPESVLLTAQRQTLEVIQHLIGIDHRLYEISELLPLTASYLAMEDGTLPFTGLGLLYAKLGQVKGQQIKPAIQGLWKVIQKSNEDLFLSKDDPFDVFF